MEEGQTLIQKLKEYFEKRDDVLMAFLFGSQAKGYARRTSDWDIAVYLKKENRAKEQGMWSDIENVVGAEVDFVVLNRAPATLTWSVLRAGIPLAIKNRWKYLSVLISASHEANAWYHTAKKYHQIFERSASLTREDEARLTRTVQFLEEECKDYKKFQQLTWREYEHDRAKKREVERWAEQIINAIIDSAEIILASERKVIPETYRMIVQTLGSIPPFDKDSICEKIAPWVELRNILAHEYLEYRWKELDLFIKETEPLVGSFIDFVKKFIKT